jgi:diguanylate cyclase (GGDEF)-like protein
LKFAGLKRTEAVTQIPENLVSQLTNSTGWLNLPPVATRIIELGGKSTNNLGAVASAIGADPLVAEKIQRIANSDFYARRRKSSNLRQSMIVLGLGATFTLALGVSLVSKLRDANLKSLHFSHYWRRALLASAWGKLLALEFGRSDAEEVFLAALLQDIGMLVVDELAPETYANLAPADTQHSTLSQLERHALQCDHRLIGAWLTEQWGMPDNIVQAVKHSHELTSTTLSPEARGFCRTVALSGQLSDVSLTLPDKAAINQVGRLVHRHFGILPNRLAELLDTIRQQAPVAENIFEMEIFAPEQLQATVDTAHEILAIPNVLAWQSGDKLPQEPSRADSAGFDFTADQDPKTGVYNQRGFELIFRREFDAAQANDWPLSLISVDLDCISEVTDAQGRQAREKLLGAMVDLIADNVRATDYIALAEDGGFVLLLPGRTKDESENVAERLLAVADGGIVGTTLSLGIATHDTTSRFQRAKDLISAADEALYHSQRSGRNCCTSYTNIRAA